MLSPEGNPVAVKVKPDPEPPLPTIAGEVIATPSTGLMERQVALTAGATVIEQVTVPLFPLLSVIVTV
jgi:hypothetical protein